MFDALFGHCARLNFELTGAVACQYHVAPSPPVPTVTLLDLGIEIQDRHTGSISTADVMSFLVAEVGIVRPGATITRNGVVWEVQNILDDDGTVSRAVVRKANISAPPGAAWEVQSVTNSGGAQTDAVVRDGE